MINKTVVNYTIIRMIGSGGCTIPYVGQKKPDTTFYNAKKVDVGKFKIQKLNTD